MFIKECFAIVIYAFIFILAFLFFRTIVSQRRRRDPVLSSSESVEAPNNEGQNSENPMQQFINMLIGVLDNRPVNPAPQPHIINFKDFKNVGPPEFQGTSEPIEAQCWIKEIEKAFTIVGVGEIQKTIFATYLMKYEANFWWEAN